MSSTASIHGINIPLFSLRNHKSSGVGEYLDLLPMIDWVKRISFQVIQLLPLNDSGTDPSPYSALSAKALHPLFISLWALPFLDAVPDAEDYLEGLRECNCSVRFDYHKVLQAKEDFLHTYFEYAFSKVTELAEYQEFITKHKWLETYAVFKTLKEKQNLVAWWEYEEQYRHPTKENIAHWSELFKDEVNYHKMCQFFAFSQMHEVANTARSQGILIKGDIPILINRDSADVWAFRDGFTLEFAAGAPPDMYSKEGQYWGFPYNFPEHEREGFAWWKERLQVAELFYDMYRLDHIVGFYRIWAIPLNKPAREGFFLPRNQADWIVQGDTILKKLLSFSKMVPIGEDLGAVPEEVRSNMKKLGIAGTKVMRWERRWHADSSYIPLNQYPHDSMTCVSTHDSETFVQWWNTASDEALLFAKNFHLRFESPIPYAVHLETLKLAHTTTSLYHINLLQEYLTLFPELSWDEPEDERINIPGTIQQRNWTYRYKPFIEEISSHSGLNDIMKILSKG